MRLIFTLVGITLVAGGLGGCATQLQGTGERRFSAEHHVMKNYSIGVPRTVTVGEPMVKVQDYWTERVEFPVMIPDRTVTISGGVVRITLNAGQKYPVRGIYAADGHEYRAVATTDNPVQHQAVLVNQDGTLHNRVIATGPGMNGYVRVAYTMDISDPAAKLEPERAQVVNTKNGYENFEILYTGLSSNSTNLAYREFSPEGMARVAFFQNLSYESGAKTIAFKQFRIAIDRATSESVTYTVLTDGR